MAALSGDLEEGAELVGAGNSSGHLLGSLTALPCFPMFPLPSWHSRPSLPQVATPSEGPRMSAPANVQLPFSGMRTGLASPRDGDFAPSLWPAPGRLLPSLGDGVQPESQDGHVHVCLL